LINSNIFPEKPKRFEHIPGKTQTFYHDNDLKGFVLRITYGVKSFIVETRINGKVKRVTLGK